MNKINYYRSDGSFNGSKIDGDVQSAVHASKSIAGRIIRMPEGLGFRYFLGGYEVKRNSVFTFDSWDSKPVNRYRYRGPASPRVFLWRGYEWMQSMARAEHKCNITGNPIPIGGLMYRIEEQGTRESRWRLSVIPEGAEMIEVESNEA